MPRLLHLTRDQVAMIDDADYDRVRDYRWRLHIGGERARKVFYARGHRNGTDIYLHRLLTDCPHNLVVHHVSGDGLDCRRRNMVLVPPAVNTMYGGNHDKGASGYWGVRVDGDAFRARLRHNGVDRSIGRFKCPKAAALAWDRAAIKTYGPYIRTNFIHPEQADLLRHVDRPVAPKSEIPF